MKAGSNFPEPPFHYGNKVVVEPTWGHDWGLSSTSDFNSKGE